MTDIKTLIEERYIEARQTWADALAEWYRGRVAPEEVWRAEGEFRYWLHWARSKEAEADRAMMERIDRERLEQAVHVAYGID